MRAMVINRVGPFDNSIDPLDLVEVPKPEPGKNEILIKMSVCGVCHTELDEIEGRTPPSELPVIPGHQCVGIVEELGPHAENFEIGQRVGVAWINSSCGECSMCRDGLENLCKSFKATGRDLNGGYAEYMKVSEDFAYIIPDNFTDAEAAPLLCAGAIGYRSLMLCELNNGDRLGLTGFGASGHIVIKLAKKLYPETDIYVFARNPKERQFASELGAVWTGDTEERSPEKLDCIIDTTPVWKTVVEGLYNLEAAGRFIINAIRKEDIDKEYLLNISYHEHLWHEKEVKSVANITRKDVSSFLELASEFGIKPEVQIYSLEQANQALKDLKSGNIKGAKVLRI